MSDLMVATPWIGVGLWAVLHVSDYYLTLSCARLYRAQDKVVFEGSFELNPIFQADIDALRPMSRRFLVVLLLSAGFLWALWALSLRGFGFKGPYLIGLGSMVMVELAIHMRHLRNWFLFKVGLPGDGVKGRLEYSRSVVLRASAFEFRAFAVFYGVLTILTGSFLVLGGALACLSLSAKDDRLARKHAALQARAA